jgi:hypothetical protein
MAEGVSLSCDVHKIPEIMSRARIEKNKHIKLWVDIKYSWETADGQPIPNEAERMLNYLARWEAAHRIARGETKGPLSATLFDEGPRRYTGFWNLVEPKK